jgi:hypothetical protein
MFYINARIQHVEKNPVKIAIFYSVYLLQGMSRNAFYKNTRESLFRQLRTR